MATVGDSHRGNGGKTTTTPSGTDAEEKLLEKYALLERKLDSLVRDVHLPFLDVELYKKYFLSIKSHQRAEHLELVVEALGSHRLSTLRILKLCQEREDIMSKILKIADEFASKRLTTLDAQTQVLQQLYLHQQTTLKIVEGVFAWREQLTRPYPFQFKGQDYFLKILADCDFIDSCNLRSVLPLRIAEFPLCSNVASLRMFAPKAARAAAPPAAAAGPKRSNPIDVQKQNMDSARLRSAESMLFAEKKLQQKVVRELQSLASQSKFVTLLSLPRIIPNCATGIPITNDDWIHQLRDAIDEAVQRVDEPQQQGSSRESNAAVGANAGKGSPSRRSSSPSSSSESSAPRDSARSMRSEESGTVAQKQSTQQLQQQHTGSSSYRSSESTPPQQEAQPTSGYQEDSDFEPEDD